MNEVAEMQKILTIVQITIYDPLHAFIFENLIYCKLLYKKHYGILLIIELVFIFFIFTGLLIFTL